MKEYRKTLELDPDSSYHYVELGPVHGYPPWHEQSHPSRYPFPTEGSALMFAEAEKTRNPDREIAVTAPDGQRTVL